MAAEKAEVKRILAPKDWEDRQVDTLEAVGEANYRTGITSPRFDTIEAGIAAEDRYAAQTKKAIDEGRRKKALQATSLEEWFKYASEIGAGRLVPGVANRRPEVTKFVGAWQPILLSHVAKVDKMKAVTDADMEKRMIENLRGLKGLKGTWR